MGGNKQNHNKGPQGQYKNNQQQGSQGQYKNNQQQGFHGQRRGPLICYGCNQEGHMKRNCLTNPLPSQQGQGNSDQGQAGPFVGQGY